jgi:hypothetical protein
VSGATRRPVSAGSSSPLTLTSTADAQTPLTLAGTATQTADIAQVKRGTALRSGFNADGNLFFERPGPSPDGAPAMRSIIGRTSQTAVTPANTTDWVMGFWNNFNPETTTVIDATRRASKFLFEHEYNGNTELTWDLVDSAANGSVGRRPIGMAGAYDGGIAEINVGGPSFAASGAGHVRLQGGTSTSVMQLLVKAIPSQTTNLFQMQSSAGAVMSAFDFDGTLLLNGAFRSVVGLNAPRAFIQPGSNAVPLTIKGATSQSVSLLELQNVSGVVQAKFDFDGTLMLNGAQRNVVGLNAPQAQILGTGSGIGGTQFAVRPAGTTTVGSIVQGVASQSADLEQWQSSAPATLFAISAGGLPRWTAAGNQQTTVGAAGGASALPATPTKYLKVLDSGGTTLVIPAYAVS